MKKSLFATCAMVVLASCASVYEAPVSNEPENAVVLDNGGEENASDALLYPVAPASPELDRSQVISRVMVGSCINEEKDMSPMMAMVKDEADLTLLIGDNVYGDIDSERGFLPDEPDLREVRESYVELASKPEFEALRQARPMLTTWDDHDYGANDQGRDFPYKEEAERIYETFFGVEEAVKSRPGVYSSVMAGPEGQTLQIILTDTRFFRSDLTPTDERGAKGKERYIPSEDANQDMLGGAQWAWLKEELEKPADLRLLISSIQIIPTVHGWEAWSTMPQERERLFNLLAETGADNTVLVSGDRHTAFIYEKDIEGVGKIGELTASSVNSSFAKSPVSEEYDEAQIGDGYTFENYGLIDIDWSQSKVTLTIKDKNGESVSAYSYGF